MFNAPYRDLSDVSVASGRYARGSVAPQAWVFPTCPAKCFYGSENYDFLFGGKECNSVYLPLSPQLWLPDRGGGEPFFGQQCGQR